MTTAQTQPQTSTVYVSFSAEISPQTTEALLGVMAQQAQAGIQRVYLLLSTLGGSVMHGLNLYNVLRAMPFELVIHNVASVNSIGNAVFLAGSRRLACPHSTFMFHGVGFDLNQPTRLEEKMLRERLDSIRADQRRIADIIAERTSIPRSEIDQLFLEAQTKDATYARGNGIVHEICDVTIPAGAPIIQLIFKR